MATLDEIRAKLLAQEMRNSGESRVVDNGVYPFWNLDSGKECTIRFLPDGNPNNTFFWVERAMIKLPFAGIKGETDSKPVQVQVPCMEMYNETCPILTEVRGWFKDKDKELEELGRKYWKKRSYIYQGFVVDDGLREETTPENPIRRFIIGPQIYQIIRGALIDPELEELPTDYYRGVDFKIIKTSKGGYADYATSKWSRRERPLSEKEMEAVETFKPFVLSDFLPKKPGEVELKVISEMFRASVDGEAFDKDAWGQYFRPAGMASVTGDPNVTQSHAEEIVSTVEDKEEVEETSSSSTESKSSRADDILAMIRKRPQQ